MWHCIIFLSAVTRVLCVLDVVLFHNVSEIYVLFDKNMFFFKIKISFNYCVVIFICLEWCQKFIKTSK